MAVCVSTWPKGKDDLPSHLDMVKTYVFDSGLLMLSATAVCSRILYTSFPLSKSITRLLASSLPHGEAVVFPGWGHPLIS